MWGGCIMFGGFLCLFGLLGFWFGGCVLILNMDGIFFIFFWIVGFISKCFGGDFEKNRNICMFCKFKWFIFYNVLWILFLFKKFMNKLFNSEIISWFKLILVNVILFKKKKFMKK